MLRIAQTPFINVLAQIDILYISSAIVGSVVILWLTYRVLKLIKNRLLHYRLTVHLSPFYTPEQISRALSFYIPTKYRYSEDGEEIRDDLIPYFSKEVFTRSNREFQYYFILGMPGMGKSCFMINLFWKYRYQLLKKDYFIRLIALNHPHAFEEIQKIPKQQQTVLLLDAFNEDPLAIENYSLRLAELIQMTQSFAKVLISCRNNFFPVELENPLQSKPVSFEEQGCYQLFSKIYIDPFNEIDAYSYLRRRLPLFYLNDKVKAQAIHAQNLYLLSRPLFLNFIEFLLKGRPIIYDFTYQVYQEIIQTWIGVASKGASNDFQDSYYHFLAEIACNMYDHFEDRNGLLIPEEDLKIISHKYSIKLLPSRQPLIRQHPLGYYYFTHQSFISYFVAERAFRQENYPIETNFKGLMMASILYQELCWERYTSRYTMVEGSYRTIHNSSLIPLSNIKVWELKQISRLYLRDFVKRDLRFIKGLKHLRGLYLEEGEETDLSSDIFQSLPHEDINIYLLHESQIYAVMKPVASPVAVLEVDGMGADAGAFQWDAPVRLNLFRAASPELIHPFQNYTHILSQGLLSLFNMNLLELPDRTCKLIKERTNLNGIEYKVYEQSAGFGELELFNSLELYAFPDGSINLHFFNTYTPTLFHQSLSIIVQKLVSMYGPDDYGQADYNEDDAAQVEDGFWEGRSWSKSIEERFAYPVHLFLSKPGKIDLIIRGIRS